MRPILLTALLLPPLLAQYQSTMGYPGMPSYLGDMSAWMNTARYAGFPQMNPGFGLNAVPPTSALPQFPHLQAQPMPAAPTGAERYTPQGGVYGQPRWRWQTAPQYLDLPRVGEGTGFGAYPRRAGPGEGAAQPRVPVRAPRPAPEPDPEAWPVWLSPESRAGLPPASSSRAVLLRGADRVWFRDKDEPAAIPLAFHDKFRVTQAGSTVEVRDGGEFIVLLHDTTTLRFLGPGNLSILALAEEQAEFGVGWLTRLWVTSRTRELTLRLPDASTVQLQGSRIHLERDGERAMLINHGPRAVRVARAGNRQELDSGQAFEFFLAPPGREARGAALQVEGGVRIATQGRRLHASAEQDGSVSWAGTRIRLQAGASVEIDSLGAGAFPESRPASRPTTR
jgi:hypothetical protein